MRTTLYSQVSKQADFEQLKKTIDTLDDPETYVANKFNVTPQTAKRFMEEMRGKVIKTGAQKDDSENTYIDLFLEEIPVKIGENRTSKVQAFFKICEEIDKMSLPILSKLLIKLCGKPPMVTVHKPVLIRAIKSLIQYKHYELIHNLLPQERVKNDMNVLLRQVTEV